MSSDGTSRGYRNHIGHIPYDILGNNGPGMIILFFLLVSMLIMTVCWCVIKCYVLAETETGSREDFSRYRKIKEEKAAKMAAAGSSGGLNGSSPGYRPEVESPLDEREQELTDVEAYPVSPPCGISHSQVPGPGFPLASTYMRETCLNDFSQNAVRLDAPVCSPCQVCCYRWYTIFKHWIEYINSGENPHISAIKCSTAGKNHTFYPAALSFSPPKLSSGHYHFTPV